MAGKIISFAARAFVQKSLQVGGNPVTVFLIPKLVASSDALRTKLAKSCQWESVCIEENNDADDEKKSQLMKLPKLFFYMPTGEEVSFCAHAAMGAASVIDRQLSNGIESGSREECSEVHFTTSMGGKAIDGVENILAAKISANNIVELNMENDLEEMKVDHDILKALLHEIGLDAEEDVDDEKESDWPYLNSSVARFKTLVPIKSMAKLHGATAPRDPDKFRELCDVIESTGVYLYCRNLSSSPRVHDASDQVYECRQFPRASYPEDPATGIAAAALAASLRCTQIAKNAPNFVFYQGTAMEMPSRINVRFDDDDLFCSGAVQIDNQRLIDI